ncbi:hypothetical protein X975_20041, partial [Stegodyphus mimosarum]
MLQPNHKTARHVMILLVFMSCTLATPMVMQEVKQMLNKH